MIKITKWFDDDIVKNYKEEIEGKIKSNYDERDSSLDNEFTKKIFQDDDGNYSKEKVIDLISLKFKELIEKYPFYKDYIDFRIELDEILNTTNTINNEKYKESGYKGKNIYFKSLFSNSKVTFMKKIEIEDNIDTFEKFKEFLKGKKAELLLIDKIDKVINYSFLSSDLRHKLILSLNISVCPYCNRQYITSWNDEKKKKKKTTADLDHFYPKSIFPAFSLSLFNFVPSCQICNSRMKGSKWSDVIYPYEERFGDDAYFEVVNLEKKDNNDNDYYDKLLRNLLGQSSELMELDIKINTESDKKFKIEKSKDMFNLKEVYQTHKSYVKELLLKKRIYDDGAYLESLKNQFDKLNLDEYSLQQFLYGYNWQEGEDPDKPLSKLTYDILMR